MSSTKSVVIFVGDDFKVSSTLTIHAYPSSPDAVGPNDLSHVFSGPDSDRIALPQASLDGMDQALTLQMPEPARAAMLVPGQAAQWHLRRHPCIELVRAEGYAGLHRSALQPGVS